MKTILDITHVDRQDQELNHRATGYDPHVDRHDHVSRLRFKWSLISEFVRLVEMYAS